MLSVLLAVLMQAAAPAEAAPAVIADPQWEATPTEADIARAYPGAGGLVSAGEVTLECKARGDGGLTDCKVVSEHPDYVGFGSAALGLADRFKLKPAEDGRSPAGKAVQVEIQFPGR